MCIILSELFPFLNKYFCAKNQHDLFIFAITSGDRRENIENR